LHGFVSRLSRFIELAEVEMTHGLRIIGSESPRIERAKTHPAFAPIDGTRGLTAPGQDDAAENACQCRRRTDGERGLEGGARSNAIVAVHPDGKSPESEG